MSETNRRGWFFFLAMLIVTGIVASTAIRIEWYNQAVGGFLPRPQPPSMEGNDIVWRTSGPHMVELHFRSRVAWDRGLDLKLADDKEALFTLPLTPEQQKELDEMKHDARLDVEFHRLVSTMGLLQYPLVAVGLFLSWMTVRDERRVVKTIGGVCLSVNVVACLLMFYREYLPSLGG